MRSVWLSAATVSIYFSCLGAQNAFADRIPGTSRVGPQYYFTIEMDPIEVSLWSRLPKKPGMVPIARFSLPRAYIFFVEDQSSYNPDVLPRSLDANGIDVMVTYPDGLPYSLAIRDYKKKFHVSTWEAGRNFRMRLMTARILNVVGNAYKVSYLFPEPESRKYKRETYIGMYSGYKRYRVGTSFEVFYGPETALIRKIYCNNLLENANPLFYCTYYVVFHAHLITNIDFVDFRVNGGVPFAEDRVRVFMKALCPYVACDSFPSARDRAK